MSLHYVDNNSDVACHYPFPPSPYSPILTLKKEFTSSEHWLEEVGEGYCNSTGRKRWEILQHPDSTANSFVKDSLVTLRFGGCPCGAQKRCAVCVLLELSRAG